ncbi:MAG: SDR family NAD(P)-dependent oxidoreductase [Chloroflexi bacterium]|nr:SDR family NAD(P)-dependent oxidoreductase [Chloroflexota bacterium]MDA1004169.1 SDR family NAD(P)-dependent oxidoreductase [Chloroflexota bacterium]
MDSSRHRDHVALVTGAGSGIGRATALRLAGEGAQVVGCDVNAEGLDGTLAAIRKAGHDASVLTADITDQAEVDRIVDDTLARHGRIDVLANVAGIMDWFLPAHEVDDDTWRHVMSVNVDGPMMLCRKVLPSMMERHAGAIVNIASVGGLGGGAAGVAYTVSKHAVVGLTRSIAWVYQTEGIRCNAICPGGVETNIGTTAVPRSEWGLGRLAKIHALGERMAQPDEIASLLS